jgi:hypothetical protein
MHNLRWNRGSVHLLDHPDLDAELAMVGLGGPEPTCVSLHHLWNDAMVDGGFLGEWVDDTRLTPAWFSWLAMALERMRSEGFHEFLRVLPPARAQRMGEFLDRFPLPWLDRAAAGISERVFEGEGVGCEMAPLLLSTAVSHRLRRAFVDAVGGRQLAVGAAALVPLRLSVTAPIQAGDPQADPRLGGGPATGPMVTGHDRLVEGALSGPDRGISLAVDRRWLHRVWGAGAAVIDGHLVVAIEPAGEAEASAASEPGAVRTAQAQLVTWERAGFAGHRPLVEGRPVRFRSGSWSIDR